MLSSIHPLGERARNQHWGVTVSAYIAGSTVGGAITGLAAGSIGAGLATQLSPGSSVVYMPVLYMIVAAVTGIGFWADLSGRKLPTVHRQVNEDWLDQYRGWVYGIGFGFQLGLGWATIITTSLVYSTFLLAALTGSPLGGTLIGFVFGLARALPILTTQMATSAGQLVAFHKRMADSAARARKLGAAAQGVVSIAAVLASATVLLRV